MNKSDSISSLAAALAKARPKIEGAAKDKNNPAFRSKYADLASVSEAIAVVAEFGLSYVQVCHDREHAACVETIILHTSGEWLGCGPVSVPVTKTDAHGFGSALTYARRYSLSSAFGVVPEDDDGNAAAKAPPERMNPKLDEWEKQPLDVQNALLDLSHRVSTLIKRGDVAGAYDEIEADPTLKHGDGSMDQDKKTAFWSQVPSHERAALKKEGERRHPTPTVTRAERKAA